MCLALHEMDNPISGPLPERKVQHISNERTIGREFKMIVELEAYEM